MPIPKGTLEQNFKHKSVVELEDLVQFIEDHFGYHETLSKKVDTVPFQGNKNRS